MSSFDATPVRGSISLKSLERIGVKGFAFKNYVCQELSVAEFSGRQSCADVRMKLSEAEFRGHQAPPLYENRLSKVLCSFFTDRNGSVLRGSFYERYSISSAHGTYHV